MFRLHGISAVSWTWKLACSLGRLKWTLPGPFCASRPSGSAACPTWRRPTSAMRWTCWPERERFGSLLCWTGTSTTKTPIGTRPSGSTWTLAAMTKAVMCWSGPARPNSMWATHSGLRLSTTERRFRVREKEGSSVMLSISTAPLCRARPSSSTSTSVSCAISTTSPPSFSPWPKKKLRKPRRSVGMQRDRTTPWPGPEFGRTPTSPSKAMRRPSRPFASTSST